jgi:hypothetical protein
MSGLTPSQSAFQATLIEQSSTLLGSIQSPGTQVPAKAPPGASQAQTVAIGLEAQVAGTLDASLSGAGTPSPVPLTTPGVNQYQAALSSENFNDTLALVNTFGLGTTTNTLA